MDFFHTGGGGQPQIHTFFKSVDFQGGEWGGLGGVEKIHTFYFFLKASLKFDHFHFKISKVTSFLMYVVHSKLF